MCGKAANLRLWHITVTSIPEKRTLLYLIRIFLHHTILFGRRSVKHVSRTDAPGPFVTTALVERVVEFFVQFNNLDRR